MFCPAFLREPLQNTSSKHRRSAGLLKQFRHVESNSCYGDPQPYGYPDPAVSLSCKSCSILDKVKVGIYLETTTSHLPEGHLLQEDQAHQIHRAHPMNWEKYYDFLTIASTLFSSKQAFTSCSGEIIAGHKNEQKLTSCKLLVGNFLTKTFK